MITNTISCSGCGEVKSYEHSEGDMWSPEEDARKAMFVRYNKDGFKDPYGQWNSNKLYLCQDCSDTYERMRLAMFEGFTHQHEGDE